MSKFGPAWEAAKTALSEQCKVVEALDNYLALELFATSHQRSQLVLVTCFEGDERGNWVSVESAFAPYSDEALVFAVNSIVDDREVGVARVGDFLFVRWSAFIETLPIGVLMVNAGRVADHADRLDSLLSGGRDEL